MKDQSEYITIIDLEWTTISGKMKVIGVSLITLTRELYKSYLKGYAPQIMVCRFMRMCCDEEPTCEFWSRPDLRSVYNNLLNPNRHILPYETIVNKYSKLLSSMIEHSHVVVGSAQDIIALQSMNVFPQKYTILNESLYVNPDYKGNKWTKFYRENPNKRAKLKKLVSTSIDMIIYVDDSNEYYMKPTKKHTVHECVDDVLLNTYNTICVGLPL